MDLDFTVLNNISHKAENGPAEPFLQVSGNLAIQPKNGAVGPMEGRDGISEKALHILDKEKIERKNSRQMYSSYQQNIKRAGTLREDIAKGLKRGEDPLAILLKAIECISLMTGDTAIYTQGKEDILAIYGWGLHRPAALSVKLEEARYRLAMLTRPELAEDTPPDAMKRIEMAIQANKELISRIEQIIKKEEGGN